MRSQRSSAGVNDDDWWMMIYGRGKRAAAARVQNHISGKTLGLVYCCTKSLGHWVLLNEVAYILLCAPNAKIHMSRLCFVDYYIYLVGLECPSGNPGIHWYYRM